MAPVAPSAAEIARFREVLGVSPIATARQIEKAYRKCAIAHHPDQGGATARMAEINNARDWLRDNAPPPSPTVLPAPAPPTASEVAAARESRLAAEKAAAEQLAAEEEVWGTDFRSHGTKGRTAPLTTTSGTAYPPLPEIRMPPAKLGKKRTREEQSMGGPISHFGPDLKRPKTTVHDPTTQEEATTTESESRIESNSGEADLIDTIFASVNWDQPVSADDLSAQQPDFVAWLEDESAWNWHMCYSEKNGFKLMGSERDGEVFLWKYCCATGAMSMAVKRA